MTDDLGAVMRERAQTADLPAPDLGAITSAGRSRVRRRRGVTAIVAATAAVAVVGGSLLALDRAGSDGSHGPATASEDGIATTGLTWATGSTLHVGDQSYDLGHQIVAYVRTSAGYVFADPAGKVWQTTDGTVHQIGTTDAEQIHLVAGQTGTTVGWVDDSAAGPPSFVLFDQENGFLSAAPAETGTTGVSDQGKSAWLEAVDGYDAYWRDAGVENAVTYFPDSDQPLRRQGNPLADHPSQRVLAVTGGVYVLAGDGDAVSFQQADGSTTTLHQVFASEAQLSPDGAYANLDADTPTVYDTRSGGQVHLDVDGFFADGYQWLDDHTLAVLALPTKRSDWQLLTCTVPNGACAVAVPHLGQPYAESEGDPGFALPIGFSLSGE